MSPHPVVAPVGIASLILAGLVLLYAVVHWIRTRDGAKTLALGCFAFIAVVLGGFALGWWDPFAGPVPMGPSFHVV